MNSGFDTDQRRKLSQSDYQLIRWEYHFGNDTIRQIANTHDISTKYVGKLLGTLTNLPQELEIPKHECSGCGYSFTYSGLLAHFEAWTSGGLGLSCMVVAAGGTLA